ncbi:MAG: glyoxalase [Burkholderiales bacterium 66-5]|uniref:VOC family protein n=1 Tax=Comamonas badia TaxID=265291 RepID=UPI00046729AA|nr:VOC family protein [Comamonas badia]OJU92450.1 MAG: glyoxalase [Burkholderiales bacterium 66-5]
MFSHIMLGAADLEQSRRFYDALLGTLGIAAGVANKNRYFYRTPAGAFAISTPINGEPACFGNGATTGFAAASPEQVDAAHAAGAAAGGVSCEDPPGWRELGGGARIYLAYLRDPTGNKLCLAHRPAKAA